jgi:hypothetical protein
MHITLSTSYRLAVAFVVGSALSLLPLNAICAYAGEENSGGLFEFSVIPMTYGFENIKSFDYHLNCEMFHVCWYPMRGGLGIGTSLLEDFQGYRSPAGQKRSYTMDSWCPVYLHYVPWVNMRSRPVQPIEKIERKNAPPVDIYYYYPDRTQYRDIATFFIDTYAGGSNWASGGGKSYLRAGIRAVHAFSPSKKPMLLIELFEVGLDVGFMKTQVRGGEEDRGYYGGIFVAIGSTMASTE